MKKAVFVVCLIVLVVNAPEGFGAEIKDHALQLYEEGKFDQAFVAVSALAEKRDADAQFVLGLMYANGRVLRRISTRRENCIDCPAIRVTLARR